MPLTPGQRRYLRGLAHPRKATVRMGRRGAAEALLRAVDAALDAHELIKIRLAAADRAERDRILDEICASTRSELVQRVGNIGTLYRERRKDPAIRLPAAGGGREPGGASVTIRRIAPAPGSAGKKATKRRPTHAERDGCR